MMTSRSCINTFRREDLWKDDIIQQHKALLDQDCADFFRSQGDPVGEGVAEWVSCIFCGADNFMTLFRQEAYRWERCRACGLLQKRPRPHLETMIRFYREGRAVPFYEEKVIRADREIRQERIFDPYLDRLATLVAQYDVKNGTLLDIGCSSGLFLEAARKRGLFANYAGVEANGASADKARGLGLEVYEAMFEAAELPLASYDVITCFTMIQFVNEPMAFLKKCKAILRPGGFAVFTGPNGWAPDILLLQANSPVLPCHTLQLPDAESFARVCNVVDLTNVHVEATGQLDVQLIHDVWHDRPPDLSNPAMEFLYRIFAEQGTGELAEDLQFFLKKHNLSGHLWLQVRNV